MIHRAAATNSILPSASELASAIVDEQEKREAAAKQKTREQFNALPHRERGLFFKNGGKLID